MRGGGRPLAARSGRLVPLGLGLGRLALGLPGTLLLLALIGPALVGLALIGPVLVGLAGLAPPGQAPLGQALLGQALLGLAQAATSRVASPPGLGHVVQGRAPTRLLFAPVPRPRLPGPSLDPRGPVFLAPLFTPRVAPFFALGSFALLGVLRRRLGVLEAEAEAAGEVDPLRARRGRHVRLVQVELACRHRTAAILGSDFPLGV
mmetsp:Transcript_1749/g.3685  ORF Transcript_1749/g.3685 Transcript_1749/m.3685 type:complete len:205 (-) Transcript_1749:400-1014(-)